MSFKDNRIQRYALRRLESPRLFMIRDSQPREREQFPSQPTVFQNFYPNNKVSSGKKEKRPFNFHKNNSLVRKLISDDSAPRFRWKKKNSKRSKLVKIDGGKSCSSRHPRSSTRFRRLLRETKLKKLWLRNENSGKI